MSPTRTQFDRDGFDSATDELAKPSFAMKENTDAAVAKHEKLRRQKQRSVSAVNLASFNSCASGSGGGGGAAAKPSFDALPHEHRFAERLPYLDLEKEGARKRIAALCAELAQSVEQTDSTGKGLSMDLNAMVYRIAQVEDETHGLQDNILSLNERVSKLTSS